MSGITRCSKCKSPLHDGKPLRLSPTLVECLIRAHKRGGEVWDVSGWSDGVRLKELGLAEKRRKLSAVQIGKLIERQAKLVEEAAFEFDRGTGESAQKALTEAASLSWQSKQEQLMLTNAGAMVARWYEGKAKEFDGRIGGV